MEAFDAIRLYAELEALGIRIWIDGGWAVDALLREQTRAHSDLDIVIEEQDVPVLRPCLEAHGYGDIPREDVTPWNFVLGDAAGREVDIHVIVLDDAGNGVYGPPENNQHYPAASLTGSGVIAGRAVNCISAEWLVQFHCGYEPSEKDFRDVAALCERFGIDLPEEFDRFRSGHSRTDPATSAHRAVRAKP